jgi:hypothetical protein
MDFVYTSHRDARELFSTSHAYMHLWDEVTAAIANVTEERITDYFESHFTGNQKSISYAVNALLKQEFESFGWTPESWIFADADFRSSKWRLDFAKESVAIEVGFNHGEAVAWNLLKPVVAGELNHVEKAIQTKVGIVIAATEQLRVAGGFDSAVGTYEKYVQYLKPLYNVLSVPLVIIGLSAPKTFRIRHERSGRNVFGIVQQL